MNRDQQFLEQLRHVRPVTRSLIESVALDVRPNYAAVVNLGIESQRHYEALYHPIRLAEILPQELDGALGNGPRLTALVNATPSNPHKDVVFHTAWDEALDREGHQPSRSEAPPVSPDLERAVDLPRPSESGDPIDGARRATGQRSGWSDRVRRSAER